MGSQGRGNAYFRTPEGYFGEQEELIEELQRRLANVPVPYVLPQQYTDLGRGTTAQRNAIFGTPITDGQRVTLANRKVTWFNTDLGWEESYYATTGLPGLTAPALISAVTSGWFPIGPGGPRVYLVASAPQTMANGQLFVNWAAPGTGLSHRKGGAAFIDFNAGVIRPKIAGRWKYDIDLNVQNGTGTAVVYFAKYNTAGTQTDVPWADYTVLHPSYGGHTWGPIPEIFMNVDESIRVFIAAGVTSAIFAQGANGANQNVAHYMMEYVGPPLVSN